MGCEFCKKPFGKDFNINRSPNNFEQPDMGKIFRLENDIPGIVLMKRDNGSGAFAISYCPFCGEKLD